MKTIQENVDEFNELQEYIDTIITTAKLLNYEVSNEILLIIKKKEEIAPFMTITLHKTPVTTWLKTSCKKTIILRGNISHEEKVNHLKKLLQEL